MIKRQMCNSSPSIGKKKPKKLDLDFEFKSVCDGEKQYETRCEINWYELLDVRPAGAATGNQRQYC